MDPYDDPARRDDMLDHLVPDDSSEPYDMRQVISSVFDRGSFLGVHAHYAPNALVGLARLDGFPVGVVANQPMYLAGCSTSSSDKIARFVRFCDAFNLPRDHLCRLPGLPARHRAGAWRHHPPRRQDHLRLLRGDRTQNSIVVARPWAAPISP